MAGARRRGGAGWPGPVRVVSRARGAVSKLAGHRPTLLLEPRRWAVTTRTKQLSAHVLHLIHHVPGTGIVMTLSHRCGAGPSAGERAGGGLVGFSHNRPPLAGIGR